MREIKSCQTRCIVEAPFWRCSSCVFRLNFMQPQARTFSLRPGTLGGLWEAWSWSSILYESMSRIHRQATIEQIQHADLEMFKLLTKDSGSGIRLNGGAGPSGSRIRAHHSLGLHLQPFPGGSTSKKRKLGPDSDDRMHDNKSKQSKKVEWFRRTVENLRGQIENSKIRKEVAQIQGVAPMESQVQMIQCASYSMNGWKGARQKKDVPQVSTCVRSAGTPRGSAPSDIWMVPHSNKIDPLGFEVPSLSSWLPRPLNLPLWKGLADVWTSSFVKPRQIWSDLC